MPKSLKIIFSAEGSTLDLANTVEGFAATVQNGLVNIVTEKGSDPGDPARGTDMFRDALQGKVADLLAAQHIANLAALDTVFYLRGTDDPAADYERVEKINMRPFSYTGERLELNAVFSGTAGSQMGVEETV